MPLRLVATDLDGTLVRSDGTISQRSVDAFARAEKEGATVVFVTGRPPRWMHPVVEATGHRGIAICANGALVYDLHGEQVLESFLMDPALVADVMGRLRGELPDVAFAVEHLAELVCEVEYTSPWDMGPPDVRRGGVAELVAAPAYKLLVRRPDVHSDDLLLHARAVLGDSVEVTHSSGAGLLEISAPGVSKATTLARLCAERGIDREQVLAFGDMPNDLAMLAWAGTAYAVANAHPAVLEAVSRHTASNDDDGVARVVEAVDWQA